MVAGLKLKTQFQAVLKNYQPSAHANKILADINFVAMMGLSGSGRNTLINELIKTDNYYFIVSDTTRLPRKNNGVLEQNGIEYFFRNEADVLEDLKNGEFLEAAIIHDQQVSGLSMRELENASRSNKIAIADIQNDGVEAVLKVKPNTHCIFVLPPNFEIWQKRLTLRGEMSTEEKKRRLVSSLSELRSIVDAPYSVIVNDDLEKTVQRLRSVIEDGKLLPFVNSKAETVVLDLTKGIEAELSAL